MNHAQTLWTSTSALTALIICQKNIRGTLANQLHPTPIWWLKFLARVRYSMEANRSPPKWTLLKWYLNSQIFFIGSYSTQIYLCVQIPREHLAQLALPQANNKKIVARDHQRMKSLLGDKPQESTQPAVISVDPRSLKPKNVTRAHHIMATYRKPTATVSTADQKPAAAVSKLAGVLGKKGADNSSLPQLPPKKPAVVPTKVDASKFGKKSSSPSGSTSKPLVNEQKPSVDLSSLNRPTLGKFGSISLGDLGRKSGGGNNKQNAKV